MTKPASVASAPSNIMFWRLFFKCFFKIGGPVAVLIGLHFLVDGIPLYTRSAWIIRIFAFVAPIALVSAFHAWARLLDLQDAKGKLDQAGAPPDAAR